MCDKHRKHRKHCKHRRHDRHDRHDRRVDVIVLKPGQKVLVEVKRRHHHHRDC